MGIEHNALLVRHRRAKRALHLGCYLAQGFGHLCKGLDVRVHVDLIRMGTPRLYEARMAIEGFAKRF